MAAGGDLSEVGWRWGERARGARKVVWPRGDNRRSKRKQAVSKEKQAMTREERAPNGAGKQPKGGIQLSMGEQAMSKQ